ncbi:MAG: restriction endonuclease subunit S [Anaerolineaceae bacterium]
MSSDLKKYKLDEFAKLVKKQYQPNADEELIYIGLEHIEQQTLRINGYGNSKNVISQKYRFSSGDILFGKLRPYFRKVFRPKFDGVCSTDIWVIKAKKDFDQGFLFYFLANQSFIDACNSGSSGTRMPRADWDHLSETEWELPPLPTQHRIADILSALDDKIELNRQTNDTLEAIAQAIFKEWFVDFNFPGATGEMIESELGMIPKGWKVAKLGEILDVKGGTTPNTKVEEYWNGEYSFATPKDLSSLQSPFLLKTERRITAKGVKQISSGILPSGILLLSSRAPIGYLAISDIPVSINQGFIAINAKETSNLFILLWLKNNIETVIGRANGSTFLEISKSNFRGIKVILPEKKIFTLFEELISPFFDQIKSNEIQTILLTSIRDTLLPKLMNGEIDVSN